MARTTSRKTTGRKVGRAAHTPEQRAERARLDGQLLDRAAGTIAAGGEGVARFVRAALGGMSPRILGYSLRNQILLLEQAEERGIELRDVDTYRGWRRRGRGVRRGETGLRIIRPVGAIGDEAEGNREDEGNAGADTRDGEEQGAPRVHYRMMVVFDVSQTDGVEGEDGDGDAPQLDGACGLCTAAPGEPCHPGCTCGGCDPAAEPQSPGALLWANLCEQITRAGYALHHPGNAAALAGCRIRVDHANRAVHADAEPTAEVLAELAATLADVLTTVDERRAAERQAKIPRQRTEVPIAQVMC